MNNQPAHLAQLVRQLRTAAGLTQFELERRSGVNRSTLMRIERGTVTHPDVPTLNALARVLGVDAEVFYDAVWQDADGPLPSPTIYFRSKYHQLTDEQIAELTKAVEAAAGHRRPVRAKRRPQK
jgi:transcriptional regulator with XRE-family HTH domain